MPNQLIINNIVGNLESIKGSIHLKNAIENLISQIMDIKNIHLNNNDPIESSYNDVISLITLFKNDLGSVFLNESSTLDASTNISSYDNYHIDMFNNVLINHNRVGFLNNYEITYSQCCQPYNYSSAHDVIEIRRIEFLNYLQNFITNLPIEYTRVDVEFLLKNNLYLQLNETYIGRIEFENIQPATTQYIFKSCIEHNNTYDLLTLHTYSGKSQEFPIIYNIDDNIRTERINELTGNPEFEENVKGLKGEPTLFEVIHVCKFNPIIYNLIPLAEENNGIRFEEHNIDNPHFISHNRIKIKVTYPNWYNHNYIVIDSQQMQPPEDIDFVVENYLSNLKSDKLNFYRQNLVDSFNELNP